MERELDDYKVMLEQMASTLPTLSALIAPGEATDLEIELQQLGDRFRKLARRLRKRSIDLEDAVTHSIDVSYPTLLIRS